MTVIYSVQAKEAIGFYYENYACNPYGGTDMRRRADDAGKGVLQGRPISAPHGAERNVGLWKGRPDEILKG
ncbi:hypothetical protein Barb6XT_03201 [Bacteroidales bacterium Barb6XT]|nr:hypothetical protein Barb6XT_03201 [Bacteroidales bacterium Barb6XT]